MNPQAITLPRQRGISILECLAAIFILGSAIIAGTQLLGVCSEAQARADDLLTAERILAYEHEKLRAASYLSIVSQPKSEHKVDPHFSYSRTVSISGGNKTIHMKVHWTSVSGTACTSSLDTIRCETE